MPSDALGGAYRVKMPEPDIIFADPPYPVSVECFQQLMANERFIEWAKNAYLVWEIPSEQGAVGKFMDHPLLTSQIKKYGSTQFLIAVVNE